MSYLTRDAAARRRGPIARWGSDREGGHTDRRPHAIVSGRIPVRGTEPLLRRADRPARSTGIGSEANAFGSRHASIAALQLRLGEAGA